MFSGPHTILHVITSHGKDLLERGCLSTGGHVGYTKVCVPVATTINELAGMLKKDEKTTCFQEVHEVGGGVWRAGRVVKGEDKDLRKKRIAAFGWGEARGKDVTPVWLLTYEDEKKEKK